MSPFLILLDAAPAVSGLEEYLRLGAMGLLAVVIAWLLKQASSREKMHAETIRDVGSSVKSSADAMAAAVRDAASVNAGALASVEATMGHLTRAVAVLGVQTTASLRLLPQQPTGKGGATLEQIAAIAREAITHYDLPPRHG